MYAKYGVISLDVSNKNNTNTLFILKLRHFFQNHGATKAQAYTGETVEVNNH